MLLAFPIVAKDKQAVFRMSSLTQYHIVPNKHSLYFEMAPSVPVNFISPVTSCVGPHEEEPQTNLPHVFYKHPMSILPAIWDTHAHYIGWAACGSSSRSPTQEVIVTSDMKFTDTLGAISNVKTILIFMSSSVWDSWSNKCGRSSLITVYLHIYVAY